MRLFSLLLRRSRHLSTHRTHSDISGKAIAEDLLRKTEAVVQSHPPGTLHTVAYSGGVDSSLVAQLLYHVDPVHTRAVLGLSPAVSAAQRELAQQVADTIGVSLSLVETNEYQHAGYIENAGQACYYCKTELYSVLSAISESTRTGLLYNGTNRDDLDDATRVGLVAAREFDVISLLETTTKAEIRAAARYYGLPNANHAASPCLRSRLALGVPATPDHLGYVETAEAFVKDKLELDASVNLRVRVLAHQTARVEVDEAYLEVTRELAKGWTEQFEMWGFQSLQVRAFQSGSVARRGSSS